MKRAILTLLLLGSAKLCSAQAFPSVPRYQLMCPNIVIAGFTSMCYFRPTLAFHATVNFSTGVFTVTGGTYTPQNGDIVTADSTGNMPAGMGTILNGSWPSWDICSISGSTFILRQDPYNATVPGPCTGTQEMPSDAGTGTLTLYLYQYATQNIYISPTVAGLPAGTTVAPEVPIGNLECGGPAPMLGGYYYSVSEGPFCFPFKIPSNATPGPETGTFHMCATSSGTNCADVVWSHTVIAAPNIPYTPPTSLTALPGLSTWAGTMIARPCPGDAWNGYLGSQCSGTPYGSGPMNYCPYVVPATGQLGPSDQTVMFYGMGRVFSDTAIYTGDSSWLTNCGLYAAQGVRDLINSLPGHVMNGFYNFTEEMFRYARVLNDSSYYNAGVLETTSFSQGPEPEYAHLRENSLGLENIVSQNKYANITNSHRQDSVDALYMMLILGSEPDASVRMEQQGFLMGLALYDLYDDWLQSRDARFVWILKRVADWEWPNYDQTNHLYMNLFGPDGSRSCSNSTTWYLTGVPPQLAPDGNCGIHPTNYQSLQLMLSFVFHFYYLWTGDQTYRDEGDNFFSHALDQNGILTGKAASESYYMSFQDVAIRTGALSIFQWFGDVLPSGVYTGGNLRSAGNVARQ